MTVLLTITKYIVAWSFGLVLENVGGEGRSMGRLPAACEIAACTSVAAASRLLLKSNCSVKLVCPWPLELVTNCKPEICMNCFSSGVATFAAIVSGLAPG